MLQTGPGAQESGTVVTFVSPMTPDTAPCMMSDARRPTLLPQRTCVEHGSLVAGHMSVNVGPHPDEYATGGHLHYYVLALAVHLCISARILEI